MTDNRQPGVLVVGTGSIGERHLRCFLNTGRVRASFVEPQPELRSRIAREYGVTGYDSLDAAAAEQFDLAVIATPAPSHIPIANELLERGLHLLIEKPLSISTEGVRDLIARAEQQSRVCGVAYVYRCHPVLTAMREALLSGRFGQPVELVVVTGQHFPTYRPAYKEIYYKDHATGGGAIQDALTHLLNAGEWLLGPVTRLVTDASHQVLAGVEVEDTVHLLARHGRVMGSYSLNQHQAPNELTLTVICEQGTLRFESHLHRWRWMTTPGTDWQIEAIAPLERDTIFISQANRFLDAIEGHAPFPCTLQDGFQTLCVNLAALTSADEGEWQDVTLPD